MEIYCTRPGCLNPINSVPDIDESTSLEETQQKYGAACGMPLILDNRFLPVWQFVRDNGAIHRDIKPDNIARDRAAGKLFSIDKRSW